MQSHMALFSKRHVPLKVLRKFFKSYQNIHTFDCAFVKQSNARWIATVHYYCYSMQHIHSAMFLKLKILQS